MEVSNCKHAFKAPTLNTLATDTCNSKDHFLSQFEQLAKMYLIDLKNTFLFKQR